MRYVRTLLLALALLLPFGVEAGFNPNQISPMHGNVGGGLQTSPVSDSGCSAVSDVDVKAWCTVVGSTHTSPSELTNLTTMVTSIKAALSISTLNQKYDRLWIATANQTAANVDFASRSTWTIHGSVTYTANAGWQGDGATGYIDSGLPNNGGSNFTQNLGAWGVWLNTTGTSGSQAYATSGAINTLGQAAGITSWDINITGGVRAAPVLVSGLLSADRTNSTAGTLYQDGVSFDTDARNSGALTSANWFVLANNNSGSAANFSSAQITAFFVSTSLGATAQASVYSALRTYLIGANPALTCRAFGTNGSDGLASAPAGSPIYANTIITAYTAQPSWCAAGFDYPVAQLGALQNADTFNWAGLNAGCGYTAGTQLVSCNAGTSGLAISGIDFTVGGTKSVRLSVQNYTGTITISGSKWGYNSSGTTNFTNCPDPLVDIRPGASANVTLTNNDIVGSGGQCTNSLTFGEAVLLFGQNGGGVTYNVTYNRFRNIDQDTIAINPNATTCDNITIKYNLFEQAGKQGHPDYIQFSGGKVCSGGVLNYNTIYNGSAYTQTALVTGSMGGTTTFTVSAVTSGTIGHWDWLGAGTNIPYSDNIAAYGTGTGGTGDYTANVAATFTSTAVTLYSGYNTQMFHIDAQNTATITNFSVNNNTIMLPKQAGQADNACTVGATSLYCVTNQTIACSADGGSTNTGLTVLNNYMDNRAAISGFSITGSCTGTTIGGAGGHNINMNDGTNIN